MCTEPNAIDLYLHLRLAEVAPKNHPDTSNRIETEDNAQQYKNRLRLGRTHVSRRTVLKPLLWLRQVTCPCVCCCHRLCTVTPTYVSASLALSDSFLAGTEYQTQVCGPVSITLYITSLILLLCFRASYYKSNKTPTWCNTVQVLFLQSHSTCFAGNEYQTQGCGPVRSPCI